MAKDKNYPSEEQIAECRRDVRKNGQREYDEWDLEKLEEEIKEMQREDSLASFTLRMRSGLGDKNKELKKLDPAWYPIFDEVVREAREEYEKKKGRKTA